MNSNFRTQLLLILGIAGLALVIYFLPKTNPNPETEKLKTEKSFVFDFGKYQSEQKQNYRSSQLAAINSLEEKIKQNPSVELYESLGNAWDDLKQPGIAAHYFELIAEQKKTERSYIEPAFRYFDAFRSANDEDLKKTFVQKSIENYKKALVINPNNLDTKTDLGLCYAEGTVEPMNGIKLLREVVQANPNHENAQLNLGFLSVKSGQFEKALERFDKVIQINPSRADVYYFKGQTYLQMADTVKALENFETARTKDINTQLSEEIDRIISAIKPAKAIN